MFSAREAAENYVENIYAGTTCASAVVRVAVDTEYRCLSVDSISNDHEEFIRQQSACIFKVKYKNGVGTVNDTEYINESVM